MVLEMEEDGSVRSGNQKPNTYPSSFSQANLGFTDVRLVCERTAKISRKEAEMAKRDFYQVLGIGREATLEEVKRAYRRLARQYHPDVNGSPGATDKFREVQEAYEVLSDPEKRRNYDRLGVIDPGKVRIKVYGPTVFDLTIWGFEDKHLQAALKRVQGNLNTILADLQGRESMRYRVDDLDGIYVDFVVSRETNGDLRVRIVARNDLLGGIFGDLFSGMVDRR